jgi:uncharacterized membrane protein
VREDLWLWFKDLPPQWGVFLMATLPIFELRGAIPLGYILKAGSPLLIYFLAVAGNFLPVIPILLLLEPAEKHLRRFRFFDRFFDWLFKRTVKRSKLIRRFQAAGLILFVAIPAPITGAWTGSVAAYLFKLPLRQAVPCIILGILIAGVVVTLAWQGGVAIWSLR